MRVRRGCGGAAAQSGRARKVSAQLCAVRRWSIRCRLESRKLPFSVAWIRRVLMAVLAEVDREVGPPQVTELSVVITDDARMRVINREFRGKDKATDVLSFPQLRPAQLRGGTSGVVGATLGDLVISSETTLRQAQEFEVSPQEEFIRLAAHGVLHLCGYDHEGVAAVEAQRMRRRERVVRERVKKWVGGHSA